MDIFAVQQPPAMPASEKEHVEGMSASCAMTRVVVCRNIEQCSYCIAHVLQESVRHYGLYNLTDCAAQCTPIAPYNVAWFVCTSPAVQEHICRACSGYGAVQHITTATTPETPAAVRILTGVGLTHTHTVDVWPTYTALSAFEQQVGFVAGCQELPKYHTTLLEFIAGEHDGIMLPFADCTVSKSPSLCVLRFQW